VILGRFVAEGRGSPAEVEIDQIPPSVYDLTSVGYISAGPAKNAMNRLALVLATVAALLACPYRCQTACVDGFAVVERQHECRGTCGAPGHDEHSPPADEERIPHDGEHHGDDGCSCLCCNGALPKPNVVSLMPMAGGCFLAHCLPVPALTAGETDIAHDRWRLPSPSWDSQSGRAVRSRIASLII
jgi:hypothetical protein